MFLLRIEGESNEGGARRLSNTTRIAEKAALTLCGGEIVGEEESWIISGMGAERGFGYSGDFPQFRSHCPITVAAASMAIHLLLDLWQMPKWHTR